MPKQREVDVEFKVNLIKLIRSLKGLPASQQKQLDRIVARMKEPDITITKDDVRMVSVLIGALFCGIHLPNFPMTNENKKLVESYSDKHLKEHKIKSTPTKSRKK
ncbi:MAG TPA: hypothetical protein VL360_02655 [Gammaproteobacteria bacterium]|jgi:hypothetical protein|nr:hypothetical protein [Gammaproteobacteria bacterium]